jgi:hypothetical protein
MTPTLLCEPMPYRTADTRELREVHRVLRRFSRYLAAAAAVVRCGDPAAARAIADLALEVAGLVRRLHAAEREGLWATLLGYLAAADECADEVRRVEAQQDDLAALAASIEVVAQRFAETAAGADRDELAALVGRLYVDVDVHLADVERAALPLAEHLLTFAQGQLLVGALVAEPACGVKPRLLPVGARTRRQRMRSARRFACVQAIVGRR